MTRPKYTSIAFMSLILVACSDGSGVISSEGLERFVENEKVGLSADQWIEMKNDLGEWERTGLVFGYADDFEECQKAIQGLKAANEAREYRCVPANAENMG